jgi:pre-mRNA-splicing factor SPF27
MPLIQTRTNNLPFIDAALSEEALASANALIQQELSPEASTTTTLHHSIPDLRTPQFSSLVDTEHAFLAQGKPRETGVDLSRYEALDAPEPGSDISNWRLTLQKAYASAEYLHGRETNLALLETYGKNAWLVGNSQLEALLKGLEVEIESARIELENVERERREAQAGVQGEFEGLERGWREGVGRLIEVLAAAEGVKGEILERRRVGAS